MELKEFEEKINSITEQFMSLLDSDADIDIPAQENFGGIDNKQNYGGPTIFNDVPTDFGGVAHNGINTNYDTVSSFKGGANGSIFRVGADTINFEGIGYGQGVAQQSGIPKHAIKFDTAEEFEINKKLEDLYVNKKANMEDIANTKPSIAFSDSNIGRINSSGINEVYANYDNYEADSTLKNKEVNEMAGYNFEGAKDYVINTFATIPADKALVEKKSWKDTLFMDIPWDTKIDIWGGIKKFCTTQVKITF